MYRYIVITAVDDIFMGMCYEVTKEKNAIFYFSLCYKRFTVQRIGKQIFDAYIMHVMGVVALRRSLIRVYARVHKYSENPPSPNLT